MATQYEAQETAVAAEDAAAPSRETVPPHDSAALAAQDSTPQDISRQSSRVDGSTTPVPFVLTSDAVEGALFDDALRVDAGEDAYCDVSACPKEAAAVLLQANVRGWRSRKARRALPTHAGPPSEQQRCAVELERRGFYVVRGTERLSEDTKAKIRASKGWENVFNGKDGKGRLTHDGARQQTSGEEDWHQEVQTLLTADLRELGVLQCSDGSEKALNRLVALKSTRRRKKGKKHQPWHADSAPRNSLRDQPPQDVPLAALLAIQTRTRLYVRPFDTDTEEIVELDEGDLLIFRGDLGHAGAEYDEDDLIDGMHLRLHVYIDSPLIERQKDTDGVPLTFPF